MVSGLRAACNGSKKYMEYRKTCYTDCCEGNMSGLLVGS